MTKSYRSRTLNQKCQIAKVDKAGNPIRDEQGDPVPAFEGLWFFKISGHDRQDHKRLLPEDYVAFFTLKAKAMEEKLKAKGKTNVAVTWEQMYSEYVKTFTNPGKTYAPPGHPEEFTMIVPKQVCINFSHSFGGGNGAMQMCDLEVEEMSVFSRLAAQDSGNGNHPAPPKGNGKRRKSEAAPVATEESDGSDYFEE